MGSYGTIVADPPWDYGSQNVGRKPKVNGEMCLGTGGVESYPRMGLGEIKDLPVLGLAAGNAHLYLWTTNAFLVGAHEVAVAWGFRPASVLTWTKTHHGDPSRVSMKTGYYFRGATEHCLFCVRGSLRLRACRGLPTGYLWPRAPHSVKPDAFFDLVEEASPGPYLELFARRKRLGWDSWGNEVESDVELVA